MERSIKLKLQSAQTRNSGHQRAMSDSAFSLVLAVLLQLHKNVKTMHSISVKRMGILHSLEQSYFAIIQSIENGASSLFERLKRS